MPLFSIDKDETRQNEIGKKEYWNKFKSFLDTPFHHRLTDEIMKSIEGQSTVNSKHLGSKILRGLETSGELPSDIAQEELGGLFGMTLWHIMATHPEKWHFYNEEKSVTSESKGGVIYFKK